MLMANALLSMLIVSSAESPSDSVCVTVRPLAGKYYYSLDIDMEYRGKDVISVDESALPWSDSQRLSLTFAPKEGCAKTIDQTISISDGIIGRVTMRPSKTLRGSLLLSNFPNLEEVTASCVVKVEWRYELSDTQGRSIGGSSGTFDLGPQG